MRRFCHFLAVVVVFLPLAPAGARERLTRRPRGDADPVSFPVNGAQPGALRVDGAGSKIDIDASFPPNLNVCQAHQTPYIKAAYLAPWRSAAGNGSLYLITELTFPQYLKGIAGDARELAEAGRSRRRCGPRDLRDRPHERRRRPGSAAQLQPLLDRCVPRSTVGLPSDGVEGQNWVRRRDTAGQILE